MLRVLATVLALSALHAQDVPKGLASSDWGSIRAAYEAERHKVFAEDGGHQARSPRQQWLVRFDGRGVAVRPESGEWTWGLDLVSYGFLGGELPVGAPNSVHADGQRLTYRWNAALDEWYENGTGGLEHGYTLHQRPAGDGTLTFLLRVRGELLPAIQGNGRDVVFQRVGETMLDYAGLHVFDADGRTLPARFSVQPQGLLLSIDEKGARYPVTVDPIAQHAYLKASNTDTGDIFGSSVAVSGDTVVVGARGEDSNATGVNGNQADNSATNAGAAYVFVRSGATWTQQAYLKASNTGAGDTFGTSVVVSGNTVVVGAYAEDSNATGVNGNQADNSSSNAGAAYVFVRNGTTWTQQAYLKASNTDAVDQFGVAVAVSGDTIVVGADLEDSSAIGVNGNQSDNGALAAGAAYVFVRNGTTWTQQAYLKASNAGVADTFGENVAVAGDTVVVGALGEDSNATGVDGNQVDNTASSAGAAYVFVRIGTTWSQQAYLKASNTDANDRFGSAVAVSGDTVAVGARSEDSNATGVNGNQADNSAGVAGAAYVFVRGGTTWSQQAYLKASNTDAGDQFGLSVAVSGDTVVVGAPFEDSSATGVNGGQADETAADAGAAYVFVRNGATWTQQVYLKASNTDANDTFGRSVAVSGDMVVVSSDAEDSAAFASGSGVTGSQFDNSAGGSGCLYVFDLRSGCFGSVPAVAQQAYLKASNTDAGDQFGLSVAVSGDTVVVGAYGEDSNATGVNGNQADDSASDAGAAYVFVRSGATWSQQVYLKASNAEAGDSFGSSVAVSGDTVVVGAPYEDSAAWLVNGNQADNNTSDAGAAYVFVRSGTTVWTQQAYLKKGFSSGRPDAHFGCSVAVSGDTVVVGEDGSTWLQIPFLAPNGGQAYVFVRNGTTWTHQSIPYAPPNPPGTGGPLGPGSELYFGCSVAVSGDTVVVGRKGPGFSLSGTYVSGVAFVYVRNGTTWTQQAYLLASNGGAYDLFGYSVAVSGDTVVVGAPYEDSNATGVNGNQADNTALQAGAAYVFDRYGTVWKQRAYLKASNTSSGDEFGHSVAVSGDTVVVGAPDEDSNATSVNGNQADNSATDAGAAYTFSIARQRPSLWPLNAPQIGQSYTLAIDNLDPTFNLAVLIVGFTQFPLPGVDLGFIGMPCCDLYQSIDITITSPVGVAGSTQWVWSPVTGSPGTTLQCQALCFDPQANEFGFTLSNQVTITLVP